MLLEPECARGYQRIGVEVRSVLAGCQCTSVKEEKTWRPPRSVLQDDVAGYRVSLESAADKRVERTEHG